MAVIPQPKQATVFNPTTGERKVVTVGDPNAFAGGFVLETPTDNFASRSGQTGGNISPSVTSGAGTGNSGQQSDPITSFNMKLMDMLRSAQSGTDNLRLMGEKNRLENTQIQQSMAPAADLGISGLDPNAALRARQNAGKLYESEVTNLADRMRLNNEALQRFETLLNTTKEYGSEIVKLNPSKEVIEGYKSYLMNGGDIKTIDKDTLSKVIGSMAPEEWAKVAQGGADKEYVIDLRAKYPDAGILLTDTAEQASAKLKNSRIYQDEVRGPVGGGGDDDDDKDKDSFYKDIEQGLEQLRSGIAWGEVWNLIKSKYPYVNDDKIDALLNKSKWAKGAAFELQNNYIWDSSKNKFVPPREL